MRELVWARAVLGAALGGSGKALILASAAGWISLALLLNGDPMPHVAPPVAVAHGGHAAASPPAALSHSPTHFAAMWLAMVLAMAPPLLIREVGRLWRTSLRRLRGFAVGWFLFGYGGIWLLVGAASWMLAAWAENHPPRIAAALALAMVWQCSPARQRCLNRCHRVPTLRVCGTAAHWDSLRYGLSTGCYCGAACGLVMAIVLLLNQHHLVAMAVAAAVATIERQLPARRPGWRLPLLRGGTPAWPDRRLASASPG